MEEFPVKFSIQNFSRKENTKVNVAHAGDTPHTGTEKIARCKGKKGLSQRWPAKRPFYGGTQYRELMEQIGKNCTKNIQKGATGG